MMHAVQQGPEQHRIEVKISNKERFIGSSVKFTVRKKKRKINDF